MGHGLPMTTYTGIIESVDSICRDSADMQYMLTRIKNIKNVTRCRDSRSAKSIETR